MRKKAETMEKMIDDKPEVAIEDMPLETYEDYKAYNKAARLMNKKLRRCEYPCRPCPIHLHPHERVIFNRNDQPENPLPVYLSNHLIEFEETLIPGQQYDLPRVVINYLANKGVPVYKRKENPDGSAETYLSHTDPRFSLRTVWTE